MSDKTSWSWLVKMAIRDSRRNRSRLLLFLSSITIGIAALVAINSFGENLASDISRESKSLLGADIVFEGRNAPQAKMQAFLDSIPGERSNAVNFTSMVFFPSANESRLSFIRSIEGEYPLYGNLNTEPLFAGKELQQGRNALVDKSLFDQFNLAIGDSVKIGTLNYIIIAQLNALPGQAGISSAIAPTIFINQKDLAQTGLVQKGSRVEYTYFYKLPEGIVPDSIPAQHKVLLEDQNFRTTTVKERQAQLGRAYGNLNNFLNLTGFIALLLGCIGVASAVHIYLKEKKNTVAILRCLGASGNQAFLIFLLQILFMGFIGSTVGVLLGSLAQQLLPKVMASFLPVQQVTTGFSWSAAALGWSAGILISLLFALIPLRAIRDISPLNSIRESAIGIGAAKRPIWIYSSIALFIILFAFWQTQSIISALAFTVGLGISLGILAGVSKLLIWGVRKFFPKSWSYVARQGLANLFRPNNQTLILSITIGLGSMIILSLFFIQELLLQQIKISGSGEQPNAILFDIQPSQTKPLESLTLAQGLPIIQKVPIITTRIETINDLNKKDNKELSDENRRPRWAYNREYRVTYRDTLDVTETLLEGNWPPSGEQVNRGTIGISIAKGIAEDLKLGIGNKIKFNVQGAILETEVIAIRDINWNRLQTNFFVVFPTGILEEAPQFSVIVTRTENDKQGSAYRNAVVKAFPNVSMVDLTGVLKSVDSILTKLSFVIQFMAGFSLLTGLMVLISSVLLSKYQRIKEAVLLRTIGASGKQLLWINAWEYLFLGILSVGVGLLLALLAGWGLAYFSFGLDFHPSLLKPLLIALGIVALILIIGLFNIRQILQESPLKVLRANN